MGGGDCTPAAVAVMTVDLQGVADVTLQSASVGRFSTNQRRTQHLLKKPQPLKDVEALCVIAPEQEHKQMARFIRRN